MSFRSSGFSYRDLNCSQLAIPGILDTTDEKDIVPRDADYANKAETAHVVPRHLASLQERQPVNADDGLGNSVEMEIHWRGGGAALEDIGMRGFLVHYISLATRNALLRLLGRTLLLMEAVVKYGQIEAAVRIQSLPSSALTWSCRA